MSSEKNCGSCEQSDCSAKSQRPDEKTDQYLERQALARRLCQIKHKVLIMSGKGGVGKSTVAVNLAFSLAHAGHDVGLMDVDIHGPNIPKMLGVESGRIVNSQDGSLLPVKYSPKLKLMSIGFLLREQDEAVIWRGPLKMGLIKQFLTDVEWGELDYLIIDAPPGTGDEPLSVCQLIEDVDGAVIVTTPQEVALTDIRKSITFCRQLNTRVLGVIENMSGFVCPHCGKSTDVFKAGGGAKVADQMGVPFLGKLPLEPTVVDTCDKGEPIVGSQPEGQVAKVFEAIIKNLGFA